MTTIHTPEWVKHAVFYQIYPDRFARGSAMRHDAGLQFMPWGSDPRLQGYQGGDLYGVAEKLDYLRDLGVTALYLNPIFASASNHRYHTYDYLQVDPLLGGNAALRQLLDEAHRRGMHVVLDGVFNHASRGFWAFHHILENGPTSPYLDWFLIEDWPLRAYHSDADNPPNYQCWWDLPALPKFNIHNPGVRHYLLSVARFWLEFGIDGWRLDVPQEITDDSFWQEFRQVVKGVNPQAWICGEIWDDASHYLKGDMFDGVMNYPLGNALLRFTGARTLRSDYLKPHLPMTPLDGPALMAALDQQWQRYPRAVNEAQLNLLDSHDCARALWMVHGDDSALRLAWLLLFCLPGAPCIYYGTEVGLNGGDDPDCREAFPWHQPGLWNSSLQHQLRQLTSLRHAHPVLRTGSLHWLASGDSGVIAFSRRLGGDRALVVVNSDSRPHRLTLPMASANSMTAALAPLDWQADSQQLSPHLGGRSGAVFIG